MAEMAEMAERWEKMGAVTTMDVEFWVDPL